MADIARIVEVVEPEAKALGFDLVRVRYFKGGEIGPLSDVEEYTLQIMAERPETGQLVIEDCAALSHRISDRFDALEEAGEVLIDDAYRLEVSSPGIDRPLTRAKDWERFAGQRWQKSISIGVSPLAVGLIFSGATLIAQAADFGWTAWLLVLATVMANLRLKLHPLWFIAAGAALGLAGLV